MDKVWSRGVSHRAKRLYFWCFAAVFAFAIALRVEAAIFAGRIVSTVTALSTLRLGETSKGETLRRIPALLSSNTKPYGPPLCAGDECFSWAVKNGLPGRLLWGTRDEVLSDVLRWWGFRAESLDIDVSFTSGKVSSFGYHLIVSAPGVPASTPPPLSNGKLGAVVIDVGERNWTGPMHPPYRLSVSRAVPSQSLGITLTPNAPEEVARAAFDLRLYCVLSLGGCRRWNELLPSVQVTAGK